jgi:integrase
VTRRSFQRGYVHPKNGKWYGRYRASEYLPDGSLVRRQRHLLLGTVRELPNKVDAERELALRMEEVNQGTYRPESTLSLANFIDREYRPKILSGLRPSTQSSYRTALSRYIAPLLGRRQLKVITRSDAQGFIAELAVRGLARQTIKNVVAVLSSVLETAFQWSYVRENAARGVRLPSRGPHVVGFIPSVHQVLAIIGRLPQPARMMAQLVALTGVRIGEAMGLRVEDCDLENRLIQIRRDIWHGREDGPKSESSAAPVLIGPVLAADLGSYLRERGIRSGFIFQNQVGRPLDPENVARRQLHPALAELGLPRFSWHRLRHFHASHLASMGVHPRIAQAQLRHANITTTLSVYTHVREESQRRAAEALESELFHMDQGATGPEAAFGGRVH